MSRWKEVKLKQVLEVKYGKDHKKLADGNVPVYGSGGIMRWANQSIYNEETILIPRKGTLSNIMYVSGPFWSVDTMFYTKLDKNMVVPKYLFYQLTEIDFANMNVGSAVPSMTVEILNDIDILLPSLPEQERIAEILSSLDDKIDLLHRQNKTLEEMAETLFRKWFENLENHESTSILNIEDVATVQNGYSFKSSEFITEQFDTIEVLKMGHISADGGLRPSPKKDFVKRCEKFEKWILNKRDIILAMTDMKDNVVILGVPALIDQDNKYVLNQRVGRIFLKENSAIDSILILYMQMKEKNFISELQSKGNSGVQVNLGTDTIRQTKIIVPAKEFQKEILPQVESIFDKLDQNRNHTQQLETLRDTLLPKLMSGLVTVNEIE